MNGAADGTGSNRPGTTVDAATPATMLAASTSSSHAVATAASAFSRLNRPGSGTWSSTAWSSPTIRASVPAPLARTFSAPSPSAAPCGHTPAEYSSTRRPSARARRASSAPRGSPTLIAARPANPDVNRRALAAKYSSSEPCTSRCSRVRLVKHTAANRVPSTRCSASACELTSIVTVSAPRPTSSASVRCSSGASGVVNGIGTTSSRNRTPSVPITAGFPPAARRIPASRNVVVVFPFVPVTPATGMRREGSPWMRAASGPIEPRTEATRAWGTRRARPATVCSTSRAAAPASTAPAAKAWPSTRAPGMQQKSAPGTAERLSWVTSATATGASSMISSTSVASRRSCRRTGSSRYGAEPETLPVPGRDPESDVGAIAVVGGTCSSRSASCMTWENTGAETAPP